MKDIRLEIVQESFNTKFIFNELPTTLEELESIDKINFQRPQFVCAMFIAVMKNFNNNPDETIKMVDYLKGPGEVSAYEKQFLKERMNKPYVVDSFFEGTTPENNYLVNTPYIINVLDNKHIYNTDDVKKFFMKSSGSDNERTITVKQKKSTGEWFLYDQMLLADIKAPVSEDPWY